MQLVADKARQFAVRVGFLEPIGKPVGNARRSVPPPCESGTASVPYNLRYEAVATLANGETRAMTLKPCDPCLPAHDWQDLTPQEAETFRQCVREGKYCCPVCGDQHRASQLRCCEEGGLLGTPIYPTLANLRGVVLLDEVSGQVKFCLHPCAALRIKAQFERFLAEPNEFSNGWYEQVLAVNPRVSWRNFGCDERERLFLTGIFPQEALAFARWLGRGFDLPTVAEWRCIDTWLMKTPFDAALLGLCAMNRPAQTIVQRLRLQLKPKMWGELALLRGGVIEWVRVGSEFAGLEAPRQQFYPNIFNPQYDEPVRPLHACSANKDNDIQEHARELAAVRREVAACAQALQQMLRSASAGLQATFAEEVKRVQQWLQQEKAAQEATAGVRDDADTGQLRAATNRLQSVLRDGRVVTESLQHAFTERASELRAQAEAQVSAVEVLFNGGRELLGNWFGEPEVGRWQAALQRLHETLQAEHLREVESPCRALREELEAQLRRAEEQEAKHQRRTYLLKALRQVCAEMGFGETEPPRYERDGDRSSRIALTVDTFNHGLVTFHLSLESIEADSAAGGNVR